MREGDPKPRPLALQVVEETFGGFAMGTAGANEDFDIRGIVLGLNTRSAHGWQNKKAQGECKNIFPPGCGLTEHTIALTDDVGR